MKKEQPRDKKYNIVITGDLITYNSNKLFTNNVMKVPDYVIKKLLEGNVKAISLQIDFVEVANYTPDEFKRHIQTVEDRVYKGKFENELIEYRLVQIKI